MVSVDTASAPRIVDHDNGVADGSCCRPLSEALQPLLLRYLKFTLTFIIHPCYVLT